MEKYGFIYIWRDRKRKMYYIGCHWGSEGDGYICSSKRMRNAYAYRKEDFKRRVVQRVYTNRQDLLEVEHRWLSLIPDDQLGKQYYNMSKHHFGHWTADEELANVVKKKLKGRKHTDECKARMAEHSKGRRWINDGSVAKTINKDQDLPVGWTFGRPTSPLKGVPRPKEVLEKIHKTRSLTGWNHSEETRKKMSASHLGLTQTEDHKNNISMALKGKPSNNPSGRRAK